MHVVALTESWPNPDGPSVTPVDAAATVEKAWDLHAPHAAVQSFGIGDGGARSADALAGSRLHVGGVEAVEVSGTLVLAAPDKQTRWEPHSLATALLGIAADGAFAASGARSAKPAPSPDKRVTVVVPVGDNPVAGDPTDIWLGGTTAMRAGLAPLDLVIAVSSTRPLLGFNGMSAAVRDGRELDESIARAAQAQEQRWSEIAREGDAVATLRTLIGPTRLSDLPGSGAAGGLAYCLAVLGGRIQPAAPVLSELAGADAAAETADLVVAVVPTLEPRTLDDGVIPAASMLAARHGVPAIVIAPHTRIGRRDLMNAGITSAHEGPPGKDGLSQAVRRVAQTWTPSP